LIDIQKLPIVDHAGKKYRLLNRKVYQQDICGWKKAIFGKLPTFADYEDYFVKMDALVGNGVIIGAINTENAG